MSQGPHATAQTTTGTGSKKVISAARQAPLDNTGGALKGAFSSRLREGAAETALNTAGILRDLWADFGRSDRFFKYKAAVVGSWTVLALAAIVVAWPGRDTPGNPIGARLKLLKVADDDVLSIYNESNEDWEAVMVLVNDQYSAAVPRVGHEPPENSLTVDRLKLLGENGHSAPGDLKISDVEVRTHDGRALLMERGQVLQ